MGRLLVVNADDYGLTPGVCEAILMAHDAGAVTSTSALAVAPAWERSAGRLADAGIGVGVHLCLVGEDPPLLTAREVPSLVDGQGRFPASWRQFVRRAAARRVDPADVRRELAAQVEAVVASGARVTHLDSHQHLHQWPMVADALFELAARHGIGAARRTGSAGRSPGALGLRVLSARFGAACARRGVAAPEVSAGLDDAGHLTLDRLVDTVERLGRCEAATAELGTHPGLADDPDRARYRWGYQWADELAALCDPAFRRAVDVAGFRLGDFGDIAARAGSGRGAPA